MFQGTLLMSPQLLARIFKRQLWPKLLNTFLDFQALNIPNSAPLIRAQMCSRGYPASFFKALNECWESMKGEIMSQCYQIPWAVNWLTSFCKKKWKDNLRWIVLIFVLNGVRGWRPPRHTLYGGLSMADPRKRGPVQNVWTYRYLQL